MPYQNLVLSGGGIHGIAYVGSLRQLHDMNLLLNIKNYAGSSVGSIFAAALACGASIDYLEKILIDSDISKLFTIGWFLPLDIYRLCSEYGLCTGEEMYTWLGQIFVDLVGDADITFKYLFDLNKSTLIITGTKLECGSTIYYSHSTSPDMPIRTAIRISTSYPLAYTAVFNDQNDVLVDGGLLDNYPIDAFDPMGADGTSIRNPETLGIRLIASNKGLSRGYIKIGRNNPKAYMMAIINALYNQALKIHIKESDWVRTAKIDVGDIPSLEFELTAAQKRELVNRGKQGIIKFFTANVATMNPLLSPCNSEEVVSF